MLSQCLVLIMIVSALSQSAIKDSLPSTAHQATVGDWKTIFESKQGLPPQYLICGAEMTYFRLTSPYSCAVKTKPHTSPVATTCVGGKPIWERCNGIKFKYCNF